MHLGPPILKQWYLPLEDGCVICGEYVPEGRMVCQECEKKGAANKCSYMN